MLTNVERKRIQELYALVEETNASQAEFEEFQALKAKDDADVFVFGSNEKGIHGGGAAKAARMYGAVLHQGFGPQGRTFAIPTCSLPTGEPNHEISIDRIKYYVDCFILYARMYPELRFMVTQVGCGLAGWTIPQIAPLFGTAPANCLFDTDWKPYLGSERKYWGHIG